MIPVYQPTLRGNEKKYVNECLDSNWISSKGQFIQRFEEEFAEYIHVPHAVSVCNGTVALHLAMLALDIRPGDEIIVPTLTYVASVNTIVQTGAKPIFVDSVASTWQMNVEEIRKKITPKTRAILAVHLYGHPCDLSLLKQICTDHHLLLIEDCAEALGSFYDDEHVGTFGDIATFSFFGNKTVTTGEGGMVVMKNKNWFERAANLKNQGVSPSIQYWHDTIGYNYRMTNICAALGVAQLENINDILEKKRQLAAWYRDKLKDLPLTFHDEAKNVRHSYWMCSILLDKVADRDKLRAHLDAAHIETRPLFYPVHLMPMYKGCENDFPIAESLGLRGINLPSWPELTLEQVDFIVENIRQYWMK